MNVLVACEYSGAVRDAFRARGHNALSCDLLPTDVPGPHYQGDVRDILTDGWDLLIAHPPCTYLSNSGVRWLYEEDGRWAKLDEAAAFFRDLLNAPVQRSAIENPIMHKHARERIGGRKPDQVIQPWMFGHGETKATGLWLKNLPPLLASVVATGRDHRVHRLPPSPDRWKVRSTTFRGIADAMAHQWGALDVLVPSEFSVEPKENSML